jgi:NAD(P)H dehydrogenase (quinone)
MHALIVVAPPEPRSLVLAVAGQIAAGAQAAGHTAEIADLAAEGFDPRFTAVDAAVHRREAPIPDDVAAEQARIDRADALVLAYPVFWWSMPGLLKGWIDRVFCNGWAYDELEPEGPTIRRLQHLPVHLVALAGADARTYVRHGYFGAMRTQIDHGVFGYCGAPVVTSELLLDSRGPDAAAHLQTAHAIGGKLFSPEAHACQSAAA